MIGYLRSILRLIRFPNLLIIAATQYAMRYLVMEPLLPSSTFELQFGEFQFALLAVRIFPPFGVLQPFAVMGLRNAASD